MSKPTEANVERVFSRLKRSVPSLRNQLSEESAEALITAASCYQYLEDCASTVAVASPSKSARTEASTVASEPVEVDEDEGSPLPATPVGRVILDSDDEALLQDPVPRGPYVDPFQEEQRRLAAEAARARMAAEEVDDDEPSSVSTDHLQLVLQIVAARLSGSAPPAVPVQDASLDRRTATRSAVDLCVVCGRPCMQHEEKPTWNVADAGAVQACHTRSWPCRSTSTLASGTPLLAATRAWSRTASRCRTCATIACNPESSNRGGDDVTNRLRSSNRLLNLSLSHVSSAKY